MSSHFRAILLALVLVSLAGTAAGAELPPGGTFWDDNGSVHEPGIEAIASEGITRGCNPPTNDRFCPDDGVTRGEMAAFLSRAFELPSAPSAGFIDTRGHTFERDVDRLAAAGITRGCGIERFCPDRVVTRDEMAAFLARARELGPGEPAGFVDTDGNPFEHDIDRIAADGITVGCNPPDNDRYCPEDPVRRSEMATFLMRALRLSPIVPPPAPEPGADDCVIGSDQPDGSLNVVPGTSPAPGSGTVYDVRLEYEGGLGVSTSCFAEQVMRILNDPRGWTRNGTVTFRQVDGGSYDARVILASPNKTDQLCAPLDTNGRASCRNGARVVLNMYRWRNGAPDFGDDTTTYRQYLVNHEMGHRLGHGHAQCSQAGAPAPVMMQQTYSTGACHINGWPLDNELS